MYQLGRTPHDQQLANVLHRRAAERRAERRHHFCARLPVIAQDPDLDQLVCIESPVGLRDDGLCETGIADHHDRVKVVGIGAERPALRRTQGWLGEGDPRIDVAGFVGVGLRKGISIGAGRVH